MAVSQLNLELAAVGDVSAVLGPFHGGFGVSSERDLDDDILSLVEVGNILEAWRHVDLGRCWKERWKSISNLCSLRM